MKRFLFLALLFAAPVAAGEPLKIQDKWRRLDAVSLSDADTLAANAHDDVLGIALIQRKFRFHGVDTWETKRTRKGKPFNSFTDKQWEDEIARGKKALDELLQLSIGCRWYVDIKDLNAAYGRVEAAMYLVKPDGTVIDVAAWLRSKGHERPKVVEE